MGCAGTGRSSSKATPFAARTSLWAMTQGYGRRFDAETDYYANDFAGCGRPAEALRAGVERTMECTRL